MRLFTALEIPPDIAGRLAVLQAGLENARWIDAQALHLTLRFIGEVEPHQADAIDVTLKTIKAAPLTLELKGIGQFGNRRPRAVWAGIGGNPALHELQKAHERACRQAGCAPEPRNYTPHVTLGRLKNTSAVQVETYCAAHGLFASPPFAVSRFVLMSARPSRGGGPYVIERSYDLG
jgi:2'-5' RNA ligase